MYGSVNEFVEYSEEFDHNKCEHRVEVSVKEAVLQYEQRKVYNKTLICSDQVGDYWFLFSDTSGGTGQLLLSLILSKVRSKNFIAFAFAFFLVLLLCS